MNLLSEITLKWYDDSAFMLDDKREMVELFLDSLGVSRTIASDIFEVLLIAKSKNISLTCGQIRKDVAELRKARNQRIDEAATPRNIQLWLRFFRKIGLIEKVGCRYMFKGNKRPSVAFREEVKPHVIDNSSDFLARLLEGLEKKYAIKR